MPDLGVWCALQSYVESVHKGKVMQCDKLAKSVVTAFNSINTEVFEKVHKRWKLVLQLIMSGKGTKEVVEQHRGLNKNPTNLPPINNDDDEDQELALVKMMEEMNLNGDGECGVVDDDVDEEYLEEEEEGDLEEEYNSDCDDD